MRNTRAIMTGPILIKLLDTKALEETHLISTCPRNPAPKEIESSRERSDATQFPMISPNRD